MAQLQRVPSVCVCSLACAGGSLAQVIKHSIKSINSIGAVLIPHAALPHTHTASATERHIWGSAHAGQRTPHLQDCQRADVCGVERDGA